MTGRACLERRDQYLSFVHYMIIMYLIKVNVTLHRKTGKIEHNGIKIEFIGQIELYYDRGNHHEFLSLVNVDLCRNHK